MEKHLMNDGWMRENSKYLQEKKNPPEDKVVHRAYQSMEGKY